MYVHRSAALGAALLATACGSSSPATNIQMQLAVSPSRIPADGTAVATVTAPADAVPPLTFLASFGTLVAPDGSTGRLVTLAENGAVTIRSPCDAAGGGVCIGHPRITAVDARSAVGNCIVELYCPAGVTCAPNPADTSSGTWGGGGSGCSAKLWAECSGTSSGYHLVGVSGTAGLDGAEVKSTSSSTVSAYSSSARMSVTLRGDATYGIYMSDDAELKTGTYTITQAEEPELSVTIGGNTCIATAGSTFAIDRVTWGGSNPTTFRVKLQAKCFGGGQICGCVNYAP